MAQEYVGGGGKSIPKLRNTIFSTPAMGGSQTKPSTTKVAPRKPLPLSPSQKGQTSVKPVSKPASKPASKPVAKPASKPASAPVSKPASTSTSSKPSTSSAPAKASAPVASTPSKSAAQVAQEQAVKQMAELEAQRKAIEAKLKASTDAYYKTQEAALGKAKSDQILALQKAYQNAVDDGELSIEEANTQFDDAKSQLDKNAYLDSQRTALLANSSGIQNSQQMLGLVAGDNARNNELVENTMSERDKRINTIRDRISSISKQKDLDIANAESNYNFNLAQARGTADQMFNDKSFGLDADNFAAQREQTYKRDNMDLEQRYKLDLMAKENEYSMAQIAKQASYRPVGSPSGTTTNPGATTKSVNNITQQYQDYQKAKTTTPTDNYYKAIEKQYNFPIGTSQSYIDNFHKKWTPPPAKNGTLNAWEKSQAMFGRN